MAVGARTGAQSGAPSPAYVRENWTVADGLPLNSVTALVQTRDGYLWLGTNDGVARLDGVRFTVYNAGNTREIPSNRIVSLHEDRAGALWILSEQQHLIRYAGGRFTHINADHGLTAGALRLNEIADGTLVLATTRGAGVVQGSRFTPITDSLTIEYGYGDAVTRRDGSTWIMGRHSLWRVTNGRAENVTPSAIRSPSFARLGLDANDHLWLADTGPGIPAEHLAHLFERFYQVDESLTRAEAGTGIGRALGQELVALHGGTIEVSSGDLAPGAVFTVTLPLGEPDVDTDETHAVVMDGGEPAHVASNGNRPANGMEPRSAVGDDTPTLLIVDDSADLRAYVRDHFAPKFRVLEASNGAEGIEVARRELPDVVILLTAHTGIDQRLAGLHGGADDYLTKPFDMRELDARVANLIALRRRLRERLIAAQTVDLPPAVAAPFIEAEPRDIAEPGVGDGKVTMPIGCTTR
jgi:CheY-like chemotaxis protein